MIITRNDKIIGRLIDGVYASHRVAKRHFYIKGAGYPISNDILHLLKSKGCYKIVILETRADGSVKQYWASLDDYMTAVLIHEPGQDQQRCLPLKLMKELK